MSVFPEREGTTRAPAGKRARENGRIPRRNGPGLVLGKRAAYPSRMPQIRLAPSGAPIVGNNPGDTLVWDGTEWLPMPGGGGGTLIGDADGAIGNNRVTSLSEVGLGIELVPISSLASSMTEVSVFVLDINGTDFFTVPLSVLLGSGVALNGDADGPSANNRVTSLSEVGLTINQVPITSLAPAAAEPSVMISPALGGSLLLQPRSTFLAGFEGAFDFVLKSRADLLAVPGVGAGPNFTLPSGSYAVKVGFALNATERMTVGNGVQVLLMGMGGTKVISGTPGSDPLLTVAAGGSALLYSLNLTSSSNASRAIECAGSVEASKCRFVCATTGGVGLRMTDAAATFRDWGSRFEGGTGLGIDHLAGLLELCGSECVSGLDNAIEWSGALVATCVSMGCLFQANGGVAAGANLANANATVFLQACRINGNGVGMAQSAGQLIASVCRVEAGGGAGDALAHSGGRGRWSNSNMIPTTGRCVEATGAGVYQLSLTACDLNSTAAESVRFNAASADLLMNGCNVSNQQADGDCIAILGASTVQIIGGKWEGNAASRGNGLAIRGDIAGGLEVATVHGENLGTSGVPTEAFISYVSGTVRRANISGCDTATTVSTCVNWAAASIPTLGLTLIGNSWDDPTPYNGFTAASARVNAKANLFQTGLMSETPIVP